MPVRLFDIQERGIVPTEHCYSIGYLKDIIEEYGPNAGKIFAYYHYMWDLNPDTNPFADLPEEEKVEVIVRNICPEIDIDDPLIQEGLELVGKLYETPNYRIFKGFKIVMDKLAKELYYVNISLNKEDGNISQIKLANITYKELNEGYKEARAAYIEELGSIQARGGGKRSYDAGKSKELD